MFFKRTMVSSRVPLPSTAAFQVPPATSLSLRPQRPPLHRPALTLPLLWGFPQRSALPSSTARGDVDLDLEFRTLPPLPLGRPTFSAGEIEEVPPAALATRPRAAMVEGKGAARLNSTPALTPPPPSMRCQGLSSVASRLSKIFKDPSPMPGRLLKPRSRRPSSSSGHVATRAAWLCLGLH
jgi:hypothetical protein